MVPVAELLTIVTRQPVGVAPGMGYRPAARPVSALQLGLGEPACNRDVR